MENRISGPAQRLSSCAGEHVRGQGNASTSRQHLTEGNARDAASECSQEDIEEPSGM